MTGLLSNLVGGCWRGIKVVLLDGIFEKWHVRVYRANTRAQIATLLRLLVVGVVKEESSHNN